MKLLGVLLVSAGVTASRAADPTGMVVIGDSLSAEYEAVPDIPLVDDPTAYASITHAGWESMSWVEVIGRLRGDVVDLGEYRSSLVGWGVYRFSGYEYNFAIPGFHASQYEDIVNSSLLSNPQYLTYRGELRDALRSRAQRVIIWLGANEFRANYGDLYDGADPTRLIRNLTNDIAEVIGFVRDQKASLQIVLVNVPDLGAAPDKQEAHPDPAKRAWVTQATIRANEALAGLAQARGIPVADAFRETARAVNEEPLFFGAVDILPGIDQDNNPRYQFTRDGLHPNTASQIQIARTVLETINTAYAAGVPPITNAEALALLGLDPDLPYFEWIQSFGVTESDRAMELDADLDGHLNVVEYAFGMNPSQPDRLPIRCEVGQTHATVRVVPDPDRSRHVELWPRQSTDLEQWNEVPPEQWILDPDGSYRLTWPMNSDRLFLRFEVRVLPPD